MKPVILLVIFGVLHCASSQQMPNLDNVGDILKSLKDSGMMDKFEQDLKQMLFDQKEAPKPAAERSEDDLSGSSEPAVDVYEFIKAYVTEKKIKLHEKVKTILRTQPFYKMKTIFGTIEQNLRHPKRASVEEVGIETQLELALTSPMMTRSKCYQT